MPRTDVGAVIGRPEPTTDPHRAREIYESVGACLLTDCPADRVASILREIFEPNLFGVWPPFTLQPHPVPGRAIRPMRARRIMWEATEPEWVVVSGSERTATPAGATTSEGAILVGGGPDVLALNMVRPSCAGGGYRIADGRQVWESLEPPVRKVLAGTPLRLRLRATVPPTIRPLIQRTPAGRIVLTHAPAAVESDGDADPPAYRDALAAAEIWHASVQRSVEAAEPVVIEPGQTLLLDCHRMLYARDRYLGDRRVDRTWAWTTEAFGFPMVGTQPDMTGETDDSEPYEPDPR